jgi:hypothetical protein
MYKQVMGSSNDILWGCYYLLIRRPSTVLNIEAKYEIRLKMFVTGILGLTGERYPLYRIEIHNE